jgi:hypothetical protein
MTICTRGGPCRHIAQIASVWARFNSACVARSQTE